MSGCYMPCPVLSVYTVPSSSPNFCDSLALLHYVTEYKGA